MLPDVPAPRRKCEGLRAGVPCPAYNDGTWPEGCECYAMLSRDDDGYDSATIWIAVALAVVAMVAMTLFAFSADRAAAADNDRACLTKEQARAKWPREYLYWHTAQHCWDNVRSYARPDRTNKGAKGPAVKIVREQDYNELDAAIDRETFFNEALVWKLVPVPRPKFKPWDERIGM